MRSLPQNVGGSTPATTTAVGGTPTWTPGQTNSVAVTPLLTNNMLSNVINTAVGIELTYTTDNVTTNQQQPLLCFMSNPLTAQTIAAQNVTVQLSFWASNAVSVFQWTWFLGVWRPGTGTLVATLRALTASSSATAGTSSANSALTNAISSFTTQAGDVLILEIWRNSALQTMGTSYTNSVGYGGLTEGATGNANAAFLNFTNNVTLYTPPTPVDTYGAAVMATSGLMHYWRLDEAASSSLPNLFDSKGNALLIEQGSVQQAQPTMSKLGNLGVTFPTGNTTDVVSGGNLRDMAITSGWSVELWVKPSNNTQSALTYYIAFTGTNATLYGWVIQQDQATPGRLGLFFGNGSTTYGPIWFAATPDEWHQIVVTVSSGSVWILYVDAVSRGTITQAISTSTQHVFHIGHVNNATNSSIQGSIDEVSFYNVVLSQATIDDHFAKGMLIMPSTALAGPVDAFN